MNTITQQVENVCVALATLIICIAGLNFISAHHLLAPFELRFLWSAAILGMTALFFRFALHHPNTFHRGAYRIATVMMFWAFGFYVFPYPEYILYLLAFPAFFYLYRIEKKSQQAHSDDIIAAGILLTLSAFLYLQQQPLQFVLFPHLPFNWHSYLSNAPIMIFTGLGFMRLQKYAKWQGLAMLGTVLLLLGLVLSASELTATLLAPYQVAICLLLVAHISLAIVCLPNQFFGYIIRFCGLTQAQSQTYQILLYGLINCALQTTVFYLLQLCTVNYALFIGIIIAITGLFYWQRDRTVSLGFIETACLLYLFSFFVAESFLIALIGASAILLALSVIIRRRTSSVNFDISNIAISIIALVYMLMVVQSNPLSPLGLLQIALPFLCWIALPNRPFPIKRKNHALLLPIISAMIILCLNGYYHPRLLPLWAMSTLITPLFLLTIIRTHWLQQLATANHWLFIRNWQICAWRSLGYLAAFAVGVCAIAFISAKPAYVHHWYAVIETLIVLSIGIGIFLNLSISRSNLKFALITEIMLWLALALIRWKMELLGELALGSPLDGYVLLTAASIAAGVREVIKRNHPLFASYFYKSMLVYSAIGWLYLIILGLTHPDSIHAELSSGLMAGFFFWLAKTHKRSYLLLALVFGNIAMGLFLHHQEIVNALVYLTPVIASVLTLTQIFQDDLSVRQRQQIRMYSSLIWLGTSAFYTIADFDKSFLYPLGGALIAVTGVVVGIAFRVRIYLYLGIVFFFVNVITVIAHVIIAQPPQHIKLMIGMVFLITGLVFTGSFMLFQAKRQEILNQYLALRQRLNAWE